LWARACSPILRRTVDTTRVTYELYVWRDQDDLEAEDARALIEGWVAEGADPSASPFEPDRDLGWFYRELTKDRPDLEADSDGVRDASRRPIWLSTDEAAPARIVTIRLRPETAREDLETIYGLAAKYDVVIFDPRIPRLIRPLDQMAEHATATFWPRGAIQAFAAGAAGLGLAVLGWLLGIPVLSWIAILIGGFLVVMAVLTFVHEGRRMLARRSQGPGSDTGG
jgi:hypothetical protein